MYASIQDEWNEMDMEDNGSFNQQVNFVQNFDPLSGRVVKPKNRRRKWTQRDMTNAFNAVKYNGMTLRGSASAFNVPESTLRDRVHGRVSLDCSRPGPPTFFTYAEEKKMVDHILFMSKIGFSFTRNQVVDLAGDLTKSVGRIAPFKYLNPSQAWFYAFLNRWPDLRSFLYGPRSQRKSKGISAEAITSYYDQLNQVLTKYQIMNAPDRVWTMDEVSISCDNEPPKIIPIGIQRAQSVSYWTPTVTIIGAGNAIGDKIPGFFVYKGDHMTSTMMRGAIRGTKFSTSPNGWVSCDMFMQWYMQHFRPFIKNTPVILLYDGHLQFVTVRVLEQAKQDGVLLFPLPPHPPYSHCLEHSCFSTFAMNFKKRATQYFIKSKEQRLSKLNVGSVLCEAYERTLQPINLIQIFYTLGICPFNNLSVNLNIYMSNNGDIESFNNDNEHTYTVSYPQITENQMMYESAEVSKNVSDKDQQESHSTPTSMSANLAKESAATDCRSFPVIVTTPNRKSVATVNSDVLSKLDIPKTPEMHRTISAAVVNGNSNPTSKNDSLNEMSGLKDQSSQGQISSATVSPFKDISWDDSIMSPGQKSVDVTVFNQEDFLILNNHQDANQALELSDFRSVHNNTPIKIVDDTETEVLQENCDICAVCGQYEPPVVAGIENDLVTDWAHCDYCNRWVHLISCCDQSCVMADNTFMCNICKGTRLTNSPKNSATRMTVDPPMIFSQPESDPTEY